MSVTALAKGGVFGAAGRVVLHGDTGPMVYGVAQATVSGETSNDDLALARPFGDRGHATQASQGMIVSPLQGIEGLCEQRGENDPTDSWQGCEDRHVALLRVLPRLGIHGEPLGEPIEATVGLAELPVDQGEARDDSLDVSRCRLDGPGGNHDRRHTQVIEDGGGVDPPDTVALQQLGNGALAYPAGLVRGRHQRPQLEEPGRRDVVGEPQELGIVAPQLLAHPIGESRTFLGEILGDARPFTQLDHHRIDGRKAAQAARVGPERIAEHMGIAAVVLGPLPEAVVP